MKPTNWRTICFDHAEWTGNPATHLNSFVMSRFHLEEMCHEIEELRLFKSRAEQAEIKVRRLEKELEEARALVASYDRQDDLIGTEFEGVDEATDVIRLLKDERDLLKQSLESSRAAIESLKPYLRHHLYCEIPSDHPLYKCICGLDAPLTTPNQE